MSLVGGLYGLLVDVLCGGIVLGRALVVPGHGAQTFLGTGEGDEAQAVTKDLVLDDGCIVVDKDMLDGEVGQLGKHDATVGIGDGSVYAYEGKDRVVRVIFVKVDLEFVSELIKIPCLVFVWIVIGEVGGCDICDRLVVNAD